MSSETDNNTTFNPRFLVVALGNPTPYHEAVHSAGHIALAGLQQRERNTQPSFTSLRFGKKAAQTSLGPKYNLLQSPTLMNVTSPWLAKARKEILKNEDLSSPEMGLVIIHDDLEEEYGVVKTRKWEHSHRGHNGVKSINASLQHKQEKGTAPWARISIGVGRPAKRDAVTVCAFVLWHLSKFQKTVLSEKVAGEILKRLEELEEEWRREVAEVVKE